MNQLLEILKRRRELLMYTVMGVSATVFNWIAYSLFVIHMSVTMANALSWLVTLVFAFVTNKIYVFESKNWDRNTVIKEAAGFVTARGVTGFIEVVGQPQLYNMGLNQALFGVEGLAAKITICLILVVVNYFSTKLIVFRG